VSGLYWVPREKKVRGGGVGESCGGGDLGCGGVLALYGINGPFQPASFPTGEHTGQGEKETGENSPTELTVGGVFEYKTER